MLGNKIQFEISKNIQRPGRTIHWFICVSQVGITSYFLLLLKTIFNALYFCSWIRAIHIPKWFETVLMAPKQLPQCQLSRPEGCGHTRSVTDHIKTHQSFKCTTTILFTKTAVLGVNDSSTDWKRPVDFAIKLIKVWVKYSRPSNIDRSYKVKCSVSVTHAAWCRYLWTNQ